MRIPALPMLGATLRLATPPIVRCGERVARGVIEVRSAARSDARFGAVRFGTPLPSTRGDVMPVRARTVLESFSRNTRAVPVRRSASARSARAVAVRSVSVRSATPPIVRRVVVTVRVVPAAPGREASPP
jgi:hypothetical protein